MKTKTDMMFIKEKQSKERGPMKTLSSRYQPFIDKQEEAEPRGTKIPAERPFKPT